MNDPQRDAKLCIVMPAYNAEKKLEQTVNALPAAWRRHIVVCDDCSKDDTVALARRLGLAVIVHTRNTGYGGNQKTLYQAALDCGADVVVMVHPDFQYDPTLVPYLVEYIQRGYFDVMLGTRIRTRQETLAGGMPRYKYVANRLLSAIENIWFGQNLSEWHTGMRAYSREVLTTLPWQRYSDDFAFDSQFLMDCVVYGFRIADVPVPVRYEKESSSINFRRSVTYGWATLRAMLSRPPWKRYARPPRQR
jgi:glycosyltransferase involved in cell wall biosynthesis